MRIYLASNFSNSVKMRHYKQILEDRGFHITSRWVNYNERPEKNGEWEKLAMKISMNDFADVDTCEVMIIDALRPSTRGGYHTELGIAYALNKKIIIINSTPLDSNVFFFLPEIIFVSSWGEAIKSLTKIKEDSIIKNVNF